ncbi:MAG: DUF4347 domain-containing protein [Methylococcaceae bacterium]
MFTSKEIVFIDCNVTDPDNLLAGIRQGVDTVLLTDAEPAIVQVARAVQGCEDIAAIHIIAHGRAGEISFAAGGLSLATLDDYSTAFAEIGQALAKDADLLLWSCHTGADERGASFITALAQRLGAAVAAATDLIGAAVLGGCWELDRQVGAVAARVPLTPGAIVRYNGIMTTFTGTSSNNTANATTITITGFTGGVTADLTDATGDSFDAQSGSDTVVAGSGNDTIDGGSGADSLNGANGSDIYLFDSSDVASGEIINDSGSSGTDTVKLNSSVDFSAAAQIAGIEGLTFTGSQTATFNANQFGSGLISNTLTVTGKSSSTQTIIINNANDFSAEAWAFGTWSTTSDSLSINDTTGDDTITGSASCKETITFASGNDSYIATIDDLVDSINGGSGTDTADYSIYTTALTVTLNTSTNATVSGSGSSNDTIKNVENFIGGAGADSITGDTADNSLTGKNGNDTINGGSGNDIIEGGGGSDSINGSSGNDTIDGGSSSDTIDGGSGNDTIDYSSYANDLIVTLNTSNYVTVDVSGSSNDDTIRNIENFTGGSGGDSITGDSAANSLTANDGNDTLDGSAGADTLEGGNDSDIYLFDASDVAAGEIINDTGASGIDTVSLNSSTNFTAASQIAGIENLAFTGAQTATFNAVQFGAGLISDTLAVTGHSGDSQIITINNANIFSAANWTFSSWSDSLIVNDTTGNDTITGSAFSKETITFTGGNDIYIATIDDRIDNIDGGLDTDTADYSSYTADLTVTLNTSTSATITGSGSSNDTLTNIENFTGGTGADSITGDSANNVLTGNAGIDTFTGGLGADTLTGGTDTDSFSFAPGDSVLTIGGSGTDGTLSGYDVITDMEAGEKLGYTYATTASANATVNGSDSTLLLNTGVAVKSHSITSGMITFDDANTFGSAVNLTSIADVAAVVQYLQINSSSITTQKAVAFTAIISGTNHSYVYRQSNTLANAVLVDLTNDAAVTGFSAASNQLSLSFGGVPLAVSSVAYGANDGALANGETVTLLVNFTEAVNVVGGTPTLSLNSGGTATYLSGSGTSSLTFTYTPSATQSTADLTITAFNLNSATIRNVVGDDADITNAVANPTNTLAVDTVAPNAATTPVLAAASDTGSSNTDNLTNDTTVTLTGTAETDSTVTIYDTNGTTVLGTGTATGGNYSITTSSLSGGVHSLSAKAADTAGNISTVSSGLAVTIDTAVSAPSKPDLAAASDTGASSTDNITNDTTATLTGTAETDSTVTIYDTNGTTVLGTGTATGGNYSITTSVLSSGITHTLTAKTTDVAGNTSAASNGLSVSVDTAVPSATCVTTGTIQDTGSASVKSSETGTAYLVNSSLTVTNLTSITGAADNLWNSIAIGVANTSTSLAAVGLSSGTYKVYTVDVAGNLSLASSNSVTVASNFTTSVTTATIQNIANATVQSSRVGTAYLVNSTVNVTTAASITGAADSSWNSVAIAAINTNTALAATGLVDGTYKVYAVDAQGSLSTASSNSVTVDTTAPTATLVSNTTINDTANATVKSSEIGTAYLVNSSVSVTTVTSITGKDTSLWNSGAIAAANTNTSLAAAGLQGGTYKLYTVDVAGNLSSASTDSVAVADTTGPVASVISSTIQSTASASVQSSEIGTAYLVTGTVSNLASITSKDTSLWNSVVIASPNTSTLLAATGLADGIYKVYGVDALGNLSIASINSVTVDNTAPTATVTAATIQNTAKATVQSTELGTAYLVNNTITVTDLASITGADGSLWNSVAIKTANANTLLAATRLVNGSYKVYTADKAGNVSLASSNSVTINTPAIEITDLGNTSFIINGESQEGLSGVSVASAGDVNGDGLDDLIVGGFNSNPSAGDWASRSYVVFGKTGTTAVNLSDISAGSGGFVINGEVTHNLGGISVASTGDVNADGLADLIVGDTGGVYTDQDTGGHSYVIFGKTDTAAVNLSTVAAGTGGFVINGQAAGDQSGISVASAGDVNGDGLPDFIVGAFGSSPASGLGAGTSYVVFAKADTAVVNLSSIAAGTGGFVINGQAADDSSGISVASAGDVNGDGLADVIVGAFQSDPTAGTDAGRSYVVFGKAGTTAVDLSSVVAGSGGFVINGQAAGDRSGYSVASAGDVNGDGLADVIVGAYQSDPLSGTADAGRSYVVFGKAGTAAVDLSSVAAGTGGFVINGKTANDGSGISVASAGDFNGDGLADFLIGASGASPSSTRTYAGRTYLVFGKTTTTAVNLSDVENGTGGFVVNGDSKEDASGVSVAAAGDVNGDGFADLIVGAPQNDAVLTDAGCSYVIFGNNSSTFGQNAVDQVGTSSADTVTGTTASETIIAKGGNDTLIGNDGADVLYGGSGDDIFQLSADNIAKLALSVTNGNLARIDGGSGLDTLALTGSGVTLNLAAIANQMSGSRIESIERIDLTGTGNNSLTLAAADVLDMSGMNQFNDGNGWTGAGASVGRHQLVIDGDGGDLITTVSSTWTAPGITVTNGSNSYDVYDSTTNLVQLLVNTKVAVSTASSAGNDLITGTSGANSLSGLAGNDFILGLAGNDTIDGGSGNDTITGGVGKDTITTGTGNDTLVIATADIADVAGNGYDVCSDLVLNGALADKIDLPVTVANIGASVSGTVDWTHFVSSLDSFLSVPGAGFDTTAAGTVTATVFNDTSSAKYLVVDMNGDDHFNQSGLATDDLIILLGSIVATSLTTDTFI